MKRMIRNRRLTPEEAAKYKAVREQVAEELPDLVARHHERMATLDQLQELLLQLKAAREAKGLSLADLTELTGMDRSALSKLETGQRANPTVETLVRYAEAVGKRLVVRLSDAKSEYYRTLLFNTVWRPRPCGGVRPTGSPEPEPSSGAWRSWPLGPRQAARGRRRPGVA